MFCRDGPVFGRHLSSNSLPLLGNRQKFRLQLRILLNTDESGEFTQRHIGVTCIHRGTDKGLSQASFFWVGG